jgi:hypothetical protein
MEQDPRVNPQPGDLVGLFLVTRVLPSTVHYTREDKPGKMSLYNWRLRTKNYPDNVIKKKATS